MKIKMNKDVKSNITVQEAFVKYQRFNELRNLSVYTIDHKVVNHKRFMGYLNNEKFLIKDIDKELIDDFTFYLKQRGQVIQHQMV